MKKMRRNKELEPGSGLEGSWRGPVYRFIFILFFENLLLF